MRQKKTKQRGAITPGAQWKLLSRALWGWHPARI